MFPASSAEVARLRVTSSDGREPFTAIGKSATGLEREHGQLAKRREPFTAIGKSATGAGLAAARQELRFFEHLAPLWDSSAPRLLGACEDGRGADARLLLLIEDLGAAGYALPHDGVTGAQLEAVTDALVALHARRADRARGSCVGLGEMSELSAWAFTNAGRAVARFR